MKFKLSLAILIFLTSFKLFSAPIELYSPDRKIKITVNLGRKIAYSVDMNADKVLSNAFLNLNLGKEQLGENPQLLKKVISAHATISQPVVPLKNSTVENKYNLLRLDFKKDYSVEFRAYNDGFAYRFITNKKDSVLVLNEDVHLEFAEDVTTAYLETKSFMTSYEILYQNKKLSEVDAQNMSVLPILFKDKKYKILLSEADLYDYPAMFVKVKNGRAVDAIFPKVPEIYAPNGDRNLKIVKEYDYIAKTSGKRSYPWRFMVISDKDEVLPENQMVYKLSTPNQIKDFSWIKPGQVTWEWWHNAYVYGVDFKSGYNQDTYKYYIDFASKFKIPYIIMDEGWAKTTLNPYEPNPTINLRELIAYGKQKNVKIILWFTWLAVEQNPDVFKKLEEWGIAGVKVDFMDRSDQWMVNYYTKIAKEAARYHILVDFHGAFKPAGLEVAYPNVLSYEGVIGMEQNIGGGLATPKNNLFLPFLRNAVGPMDYTPGAMRSGHPKDYKANWINVMSIGTRAHQIAMYIVFESGFQMLADNPFNYLREPETTSFITGIPVTWDETKIIKAEIGEYIVTAKRKGQEWFVGAMTNSTERKIMIDTDFLSKDKSYELTLIKDGINADFQAMDFKRLNMKIKSGDKINIDMVKDGGYAAHLVPLN
ncbi:glycoside hydrolase family 97 protein [Pedobacter rhodius]|uniref:Glycoside hydrolase family 97 protein n=1 Tax=Pedobacter rhodius TaxID=3004098 RepID=A0ABT4KZ76_9SPHI|nr:glycoside hydrolase family 97 protein [Pedobacter sp. SJ11]MCZ4224240.1 glycoside hydrolase family 97 protein [Pedobacter sp. SJ11]